MILTERNRLAAFLLLYLAASLLHFTHNAEFLGDYPNLPAWLTRSMYLTWAGSAVVGTRRFYPLSLRSANSRPVSHQIMPPLDSTVCFTIHARLSVSTRLP